MAVGLASAAKRRLHETEAELTASRAAASNLEARLEREVRLRAGLQLTVDAGEAWGEHTRELEERCAGLEADVTGLHKVVAHLHRKCSSVQPGGGAGGARAAAFGVELSDGHSVLFFCFKFWQQLSRTPLDLNAPLTPPTPNPLLYNDHHQRQRHNKSGDGGGGGGGGEFDGFSFNNSLPPPLPPPPLPPPPPPPTVWGPIATATPPRPAIASAAAYYRRTGGAPVPPPPPSASKFAIAAHTTQQNQKT